MNKAILICLPFAGGSGYTFQKWQHQFKCCIEVKNIELKGRGVRSSEPFNCSIQEAALDVFEVLQKEWYKEDIYLFGCSMGALISYELSLLIENSDMKFYLKHLFVAAKNPPHYSISAKIVHLDDNSFVKALLEYGGTTKEIVDNVAFVEYFLPILRSDFRLVESYKFNNIASKLNCDLSVLYGSNDNSVSKQYIQEWANISTGSTSFHEIPGNHFFIINNSAAIIEHIEKIILGL